MCVGNLWWLSGKESACNAGEVGWSPRSGRSSGGGKENPLQYFAWEIPSTEEPGRLQSMGLQNSWTQLSI